MDFTAFTVSAVLLSAFSSHPTPWRTIEAGSEQRPPVYVGASPREMAVAGWNADYPWLPTSLRQRAEKQAPLLAKHLKQEAFEVAEEAREKAEANNFLSNLKSDLRIGSIYYPVCSQDATLEPVFTGKITYLDKKIKRHDAGKLGLLGDFTNPPPEIIDGAFDAAFIRDLHLHLQEAGETSTPEKKLSAILKKVKPEGTVIYGIRKACPKWKGELSFLESQNEKLIPVSLLYSNENFRVFAVKQS